MVEEMVQGQGRQGPHNNKPTRALAFIPHPPHAVSFSLCLCVSFSLSSFFVALHRFDLRLRSRDPVKASQRLRYVSGLKQTYKLLRVAKVKCIIVAATIEANTTPGGLDELLDDVLDAAREQKVPIIFALTRRTLGRALGLQNDASSVGILDYSGVGDAYKLLLQRVQSAQEEWSMFQADSLLNPQPQLTPAEIEQQARERQRVEARQQERAKLKKLRETEVARADQQRKAYELARRIAASNKSSGSGGGSSSGGAKKKKSRPSARDRDLQPLPVLSEEDAKGRRRRRGKRNDAAADAHTAATTADATEAQALKGAGRALNDIAQAMAEDKDERAHTSKKSGKSTTGKKEGRAAPTPTPASESTTEKGNKSHKKSGKSDKKGKGAKSNK